MKIRRFGVRFLFLTWCVTSVLGTELPAVEPQRPIRESITLPVNSQVLKTLFTADEYLAEQRYDELTELLVETADAHAQDVVEVPQETNSQTKRYVNVARYCQQLLSGLPVAGRTICRKHLDPSARRWWDDWLATNEPSHLERIVQSAYISSVGDDALWALAEAAWDRGDFSLAEAYWEQLDVVEGDKSGDRLHYPDPDYSPADVQARRLLCALFLRQFDEAEHRLAEYRQRFGEAPGTLAGRSGELADILTELLAEARRWESSESNPEMSTFGGSAARQQQWPVKLDVGPLRWSAAWPVRNLPAWGGRMALDQKPLRFFPATDDQRVYVCDGDAIRAWNLLTGEPAWPNDQADPSVIYPTGLDTPAALPTRPCLGVAWQTLTLSQGKLLARMGSPVTGSAGSELANHLSELVCLDVQTGQGKLQWKITQSDLPSEGPLWSFEGTPVAVERTAYALLYRRFPEPEYGLLSFDVDTGEIYWLRSIGAALPVVGDALNRVSHLLLTSGQGRLYVSTDQGTILAMSPDDGRLIWAVAYESQPRDLLLGQPAHLQVGLMPPVYTNGFVFVVPNDSTQMFCLRADSGQIVWQRSLPERLRHVIGVTTHNDRQLVIVSGNSLWAYHVSDGTPAWRLTQSDPEERGYGQGVLTDESLFWPTRDYLFQLDPTTGELQRKIPLRTPDSAHYGGHLAVANGPLGLLIVAESDRVSVYGEYRRLKEKLRFQLSQRSEDVIPWQLLLNLEASAGRWDDAVEAGRQAWKRSTQLNESARNELNEQFTAVLRQQLARKSDAGDDTAQEQLYRELSQLLSKGEARLRFLREWARFEIKQQRPAAAVDRLHEALAQEDTQHHILDGEPADQVLRNDLEKLLRDFGREPFLAVDQAAEQEFAAAKRSADVAAERDVLRRYPFWEPTREMWLQLVQEAVQQHRWPVVWMLLDDWQSATDSETQQRVVEQQRIRALKLAGYTHSAAYRTQLYSNAEVRNSPREDRSFPTWRYLERCWQVDLPESAGPIVPRGFPPSVDLACLLVPGNPLRAYDRRTGKIRWQQLVEGSPPQWAGYTETHLVLASPDGLSARQLETGDLLWTKPGQADRKLVFSDQTLHLTLQRLMWFDVQRGVTAYSPATGEILWEFRPPRGQLQSQWMFDAERVLLQTLDPNEVGVVDATNGKLIQSWAGTNVPWTHSPVAFPGSRYGIVAGGQYALSYGPSRHAGWKYVGAISHANAAPWWVRENNHHGLLIDGSTLVGVAPETGQRLWGTGLADRPLTKPDEQVVVSNGLVLAAAHATLRAVSLSAGRTVWEQSLPVENDAWKITTWPGYVAVNCTSHGISRWLMFRSHDGHLVQMLTQPTESTDGSWISDEQGVIFTSTTRMTAWQPMKSGTGGKNSD